MRSFAYECGTTVQVRTRTPLAPLRGTGWRECRSVLRAVGGRIRTGPATGGGYLVEVVLPVKIEDPA